MNAFLVALQFLTRLPVATREPPTADAIARSLIYYPLVGLVIGMLLAALHWLLGDAPAPVRAAAVLTAWAALTGGLHLDGLADSADAWAGAHGDRRRALAIMKDPHNGASAVVVLVLILLIKFASLASVAPADWRALVFVPALARGAIPLLLATTPYVRRGGLGAALAAGPFRASAIALVTVTASAALVLIGLAAVWLLAALCVVLVALRGMMMRRLGGTTGDTAGALIEIAEAGLLLTLAL